MSRPGLLARPLHPTLLRLDDLAAHLAADDHVQAVLGLGSAGEETHRFDEHSDIDVFVVVDSATAKQRYLQDPGWLAGFGGRVAFSFANDPNGRKALFEDGLFVEYAVFTPDELAALPVVGARLVWSRDGRELPMSEPPPSPTALDTVDFHVNEALTNLCVGLHRELRGERLTAMRFTQVYAVDRVLALVRLDPASRLDHPDRFESTRRIEQADPPRHRPGHHPGDPTAAGPARPHLSTCLSVGAWQEHTPEMSSYSRALEVAHEHALDWLGSLGERPVPPQASIEEVVAALGPELPQRGCPPEEAVALLAEASDAGLTATASGRFFGSVVGGTHPAAMAADWLVSAWDQNTGLRTVTPAQSAVEDIAGAWLFDLLGLPAQSAVGFMTGATMANFTALAAGRDAVLRRAGWDVTRQGLAGGPRVRVLVGEERHDTVDVALHYLGSVPPRR
ncbi:aminoglycoside 6-adenylyltransferase [Serinicoccus marinus]|uniref:aminoglycoside 6-adenylyltransferase n=1 Tax=Serinicoccus marinus TaxID=247333 RepID=UPI00040463D2|nr:aminoglycoside 6-adenylyltransferase [Serinicoccus marinus]